MMNLSGLFTRKLSYVDLDFHADCHCHLLPGVDDGAATAGVSHEALRRMIAMGISSAVLTPHMNPEIYKNTEDSLRERYSRFTAELPEDISSRIALSLGAEYMVSPGFEDRDFSELLQFRPGNVLIEMSYLYPSRNIEQTLFNLAFAGLQPVIAHPERYLYYADSLKTFERFYDMGAVFQMNLLSLGGTYGPASLHILKYILDRGWYSYIATDAHTPAMLDRIAAIRFDRKLLFHQA